jgi:amylosucrase
MTQAFLQQIIALENQDPAKTNDLDKLIELRLSTNLCLIKDVFFSLYPEETHSLSFKRLLMQLPALFKERPTPLKLQDIHWVKQGD